MKKTLTTLAMAAAILAGPGSALAYSPYANLSGTGGVIYADDTIDENLFADCVDIGQHTGGHTYMAIAYYPNTDPDTHYQYGWITDCSQFDAFAFEVQYAGIPGTGHVIVFDDTILEQTEFLGDWQTMSDPESDWFISDNTFETSADNRPI